MSQKKVDEYKARKKTRVQDAKKERRSLFVQNTCIVLFVVAVFGWFGYSAFSGMAERQASMTIVHSVNGSAITTYLDDLKASFTDEGEAVDDTTEESTVEESVEATSEEDE